MATMIEIETIRDRAYNDTARRMRYRGVALTHEQAAELGQEALDWLTSRIGLLVYETDGGVFGRSPVGCGG